MQYKWFKKDIHNLMKPINHMEPINHNHKSSDLTTKECVTGLYSTMSKNIRKKTHLDPIILSKIMARKLALFVNEMHQHTDNTANHSHAQTYKSSVTKLTREQTYPPTMSLTIIR